MPEEVPLGLEDYQFSCPSTNHSGSAEKCMPKTWGGQFNSGGVSQS